MLHRWNMYVNQGERRIPQKLAQGDIDLACVNPDDENYMHKFDPILLWAYLESEADLSIPGIYLSLFCTERVTYAGKQWFVFTAYNTEGLSVQDGYSREVSWQDIRTMEFWNASFRNYANIYQARSIQDYSVFVARNFGYCFLLGTRYDDDDESEHDFTNFFPSIHHYHQRTALQESNLYAAFDAGQPWYPRSYSPGTVVEGVEVNEAPSLSNVVDDVRASVDHWAAAAGDIELEDLLRSTADSPDEEEEGD